MRFNVNDPYDALAAIFLGPDDGERPVASAVRAPAGMPAHASAARSSSLSLDDRSKPSPSSLLRVTAAVTGHLPVMAGLWATQFADRIGAVDGPTGLIRTERELIHVEILRSGGRQVGLRNGESFDEWLTRAAQLVRRWVICLPGTSDPSGALDPGFAERVLLTSADDAAVAAARRAVEAFAAGAGNRGAVASLGLVVVGAPAERVSWLADQLADVTRGLVDLPLSGAIQRIDRVESAERYGFDAAKAPSAEELLRMLESAAERAIDRLGDGVVNGLRKRPVPVASIRSTQSPGPASPASPALPASTESRQSPEPTESPGSTESTEFPKSPEATRSWRTPPVGAAEAPWCEPPGASPARAPVLETALPPVATSQPEFVARAPAPKAATCAHDPAAGTRLVEGALHADPSIRAEAAAPRCDDLVARIAGLASLRLRCPVAPAVELAVDSQARLHLLAMHADAPALRAARAWAITNESLLVRAFPQLDRADLAPFAARIVERIGTFDATELESQHGTGAALDLFVELRLGGTTLLHHVPLNRAAK